MPTQDPAKRSESDVNTANTLIQKGLPEPKFTQTEKGKWQKQILFSQCGFIRPQEMVAIIGPSGSGKTSLLNILSQRNYLSDGSYVNGDVSVNGRRMRRGDFGKIAAFVQQDDVLHNTYTPLQNFRFAAKMRTNLNA